MRFKYLIKSYSFIEACLQIFIDKQAQIRR